MSEEEEFNSHFERMVPRPTPAHEPEKEPEQPSLWWTSMAEIDNCRVQSCTSPPKTPGRHSGYQGTLVMSGLAGTAVFPLEAVLLIKGR